MEGESGKRVGWSILGHACGRTPGDSESRWTNRVCDISGSRGLSVVEIEGDIRARVCYPRQETWMHPEIYAIYQPVPMSSIKDKRRKKQKNTANLPLHPFHLSFNALVAEWSSKAGIEG